MTPRDVRDHDAVLAALRDNRPFLFVRPLPTSLPKEKSINELIEGERYAGFDDLIISRIERASEQQELMMVNSRGRGVLLFWLGIILIGLLLSGPIVAAYTYYYKEPSTKETIREFVDLKKEIGEIPKEISLSLNRDWHLLLGGITFGFLCLAASRGILAQQANEMKTYFELGQRARYFDRLKSVVEILSKQDRRKSKLEKEILQLVIDKLLNEFPNKDANEGGGEPKETSVDKSIVSETVKEAASRLQTS